MFRKDLYKTFMTFLLMAGALAAGVLPLRAQATAGTPNGTQIDSMVACAYQGSVAGSTETVFSNVASVTVSQPVVAPQKVTPVAGVTLTPISSTQRVIRPVRTLYPLTLRNTGQAQDTLTLVLTPTAGWSGTLVGYSATTPLKIPIGPGQSRALTLLMTPPASLTRTTSGTVLVKAVSANDPTQSAQATVTTTSGAGLLALSH